MISSLSFHRYQPQAKAGLNKAPVAAPAVQFGISMSTDNVPVGFDLFEPLDKQRILAKPVFLSYHPCDTNLAKDVTQILNTFGLAVVKRNWGVQPTLSPTRQHDWILGNTKHTFALVSPQYSDTRGTNVELAQTLMRELIECHEYAKTTGADRGVWDASYVYPLMVRNGKLENYIGGYWPTQANLSDNPDTMMRQILMVARGIPDLAF
jgi:hypothetical protein